MGVKSAARRTSARRGATRPKEARGETGEKPSEAPRPVFRLARGLPTTVPMMEMNVATALLVRATMSRLSVPLGVARDALVKTRNAKRRVP